jgi:hypothetical protein
LRFDIWNLKLKIMAHKKGEGSVKNNRDSQSKRLGVKRSEERRVGKECR